MYYCLFFLQVIYRQQWNDILLAAISSLPSIKRNVNCGYCGSSSYNQTTEKLSLDLNISSLSSLTAVANEAKNQHSAFAGEIDTWRANLQEKVDAIQKFSTFI